MYEDQSSVTRAVTLSRTYTSNSGANLVSSYQKSAYSWTNLRSGGRVFKWKIKIAKGIQATSPCSGTITKMRSTPGTIVADYRTSVNPNPVYWRYRSAVGDIFYNVTLPSLPLSSTLTDPENLAREKFYQKYRSAQTSFQGGVFLGELKETLRMLRSPAKALRKKIGSAYDAMYRNRHKAGRTVRSRNRYLSETWLEQSYGWAPLINDVKDAHETLEKRKEWLQREEIYVSAPYVATTETLTTGPGDVNLGYVSKYKDTKTSLVWYRGTIRAGRDSVFQSERHLWGFDPSMIVPTVWELIPYSFLIDYFTNIGKVLDSWSLQRVTLGWGARTERRSVIRQIVDVRDTFNPSLYPVVNERTFYPSEFTYHNTTFYRVPINEVPLPDFRFKIPGFGSKWINIAALTRVKTSKWW